MKLYLQQYLESAFPVYFEILENLKHTVTVIKKFRIIQKLTNNSLSLDFIVRKSIKKSI